MANYENYSRAEHFSCTHKLRNLEECSITTEHYIKVQKMHCISESDIFVKQNVNMLKLPKSFYTYQHVGY